MFRVNESGFSLDLDNGYSVSIQFSPFHYCSNRKDMNEYRKELYKKRSGKWIDCNNAETAVIDTETGAFIPIENEDVQGYQTVADVIKLIKTVSQFPFTDSKINEKVEQEIELDNNYSADEINEMKAKYLKEQDIQIEERVMYVDNEREILLAQADFLKKERKENN